MSHVTDIKLRIRDLDALAEACEVLGMELIRGKKTYAWWGTYVGDSRSYGSHQPSEMGRCSHAIKIKGDAPKNGSGGPWEIGVVETDGEEGFGLYYDTYGSAGRRLSEFVGPGANRLRQEYAAAVATKKAKATLARKGFVLKRETLDGGRIRLRAVRR